MYLDFFRFRELPFALTPDPEFFCHLKGWEAAHDTIIYCLQSGEGFVKIVGEVGTGKTLLCRKLLDSLEGQHLTAWIPNPDLSPTELRRVVARELGMDLERVTDLHDLQTALNAYLLQLHAEGKRAVLLIDEAQALTDDSLEAVRLLTNLETNKTKLLQVVLFGQPELDERLKQRHLRQLQQRITFSCRLPCMTRRELNIYLFHRLAVAGNTRPSVFSGGARALLFRASKGTPRLVNILCHKALLVAYGRGREKISRRIMLSAIEDTEAVALPYGRYLMLFAVTLGILTGAVLCWYFAKGII